MDYKRNLTFLMLKHEKLYFLKCIGYAEKILPFVFNKYQGVQFFSPQDGKM